MDTFIQITGHPGCFKKGTKPDTILKLSTGNEESCLMRLSKDKQLNPFVPHVVGTHKEGDNYYLEMQNLLVNFHQPAVMDVKMGCRTYREQELGRTPVKTLATTSHRSLGCKDLEFKQTGCDTRFELRPDMYEKMIKIDQNEPSEEENRQKAITKPRYMAWRETVSSTASLGFRIEGMRLTDGTIDTDFKLTKYEQDIRLAFSKFFNGSKSIGLKYLQRLKDLHKALTASKNFFEHEIIGSSLLFVHDNNQAGVWMIDFAKTYQLGDKLTITHQEKWQLGNHEDGYLTGLDNLIRLVSEVCEGTC